MKICIYSRVSTGEQETENQVMVLTNWANQRGFEVVKVYQEAESAWRNGHQRELANLIADARRRADEVAHEARARAEQLVADARMRVQEELDRVSQRRAISAPPPRGVPPPFVDAEAGDTHHGRMPVFWA